MSKFKITAMLLSIVLIVTGMTACGQNASASAATDGRIKIVCTIFPEYDWVKQILGSKADKAEVTYLLSNGIDLHNFQPTADDIIKISSCDLFLYVGGESDEWAEDALSNASNKNMKVISLLDSVGENAKIEEIKEGMQGEEEEENDGGEEDPEYDEHVWLSVRSAKLICTEICDKLCGIDPTNAETYKNNLAAYTNELNALDKDFEATVSAAAVKTVIFGDRFPFRYFTDDYGLDYYAAFAGCSAETEASFETIVFLAGRVDDIGCKTIYTIENSDKSIAQTIINSTKTKDQQIAELNSLQSIGSEQADSGTTYISLMRNNLEVLKETLK